MRVFSKGGSLGRSGFGYWFNHWDYLLLKHFTLNSRWGFYFEESWVFLSDLEG